MKFHLLKLFGFFVVTERVGQIQCPNSGQVALYPDDYYEINTPFSLKYSSRSWQNASYKSQIKKYSFKKITFCPNFRVFSFDFSEELISVLKPLKTSSVLEFGSQKSLFLKIVLYYQFWFYTQHDKFNKIVWSLWYAIIPSPPTRWVKFTTFSVWLDPWPLMFFLGCFCIKFLRVWSLILLKNYKIGHG